MNESGEEKVLQAQVVAAHKTSIHHKESIAQSAICGCFHCLEVFTPDNISEWTDTSEAEPKYTALCSMCGLDSVIGSDSGYPITKEFLRSMQKYWF